MVKRILVPSDGTPTSDKVLELRVVVGTHGRHGLGRILPGSGAEQVIRMVPVLVIRGAEATGTS